MNFDLTLHSLLRLRTLVRHALGVCACGMILALVIPALHAQDDTFDSDPFSAADASTDRESAGDIDDAGFGFDDEPAANAAAVPATTPGGLANPSDNDPLVFILRENPPKTPREFGRAIRWMTELGYWSEVAGLLDQVNANKWNLTQNAELARSAGGPVWLRLRNSEVPLSDAHRKLVNSIFQSPANVARDPRIIDAQIVKLASPESNIRRMAQGELQQGGSVAIARLMQRLLEGDPKVAASMLAGTIVEFGPEGIEALQAACSLSDPTRSARAVLAIADLPSNHFPSEIAAALYSAKYPPEVKKGIADRLAQRNRKIPSEPATQDYLHKAFNNALGNYQSQRMSRSPFPMPVWRSNEDGTKIVQHEASKEARVLERLAQVAGLRASLEKASPSVLTVAEAIGLQRAYQWDPNSEPADAEVLLFSKTRNPAASLTSVFDQASRWEMHGACVRSLQLLQKLVAAGQAQPPIDFLSKLLSDPRPVIRYQAFDTLAAVDPQANYAGSERALATALEMLQLGQGPRSLIVGANLELCMAAESAVCATNSGDAIVVTSGRDALRELSKPNPAELIFLVDRVHDLSLFELLQRIRNTQGGGSLPIAVLIDELHPHELKLINNTPGVVASVLSREPTAMQNVVRQMLSTLDTRPLTSQERGRFAKSAEAFLTKISSDRQTYSFYPVDNWRQTLDRLPPSASFSAQASVLGGLASSQSQLRLVQLVAAAGASAEDRRSAAVAFEKSIRNFGNMLSQQDVLSAYELYNRLGPNDPVIARTMGFVLDVIEAQAGNKVWPEAP